MANRVLAALPVWNAMRPKETPTAVQVVMEFTAGSAVEGEAFDFIELAENRVFSTVQAVWVENPNAGAVTLQVVGTDQRVVIRPQTQGMYPIVVSGVAKFIAYAGGAQTVKATFFNVPQPYFTSPLA